MRAMNPSMRGTSGWALACVCLVLGACERASDPAAGSLEQSVAAPQSRMMALSSTSVAQAPAQAVATLPPEAGDVADVRGHAFVDGFRQDIFLKGSPLSAIRNSVTVLARTSHVATLDEATPLFKPMEAAIRSEIGRQFPHVAMQVVERSSSNGYGPYGLALGRGQGDAHCLYMWQWVDENRLPPEAGLSGPVSVRVRLCQSGTTFDAMAAMLDHLTIRMAGPTSVAANDGGIVDAPATDKPVATKKARHASVHHARHIAARRDETRDEAVLTQPVVSPQPASTASFATDLPPQALLGPKAASAGARPN